MRLFLFEAVCSGAFVADELPESLLREGRAMRDALAADLQALPGIELVTTCDPRVPGPVGAECHPVETPVAERRAFERLCRECDAVLVIAPELEGCLLDRCRVAAALSPRLLNGTPSAVELCGDKYALSVALHNAGVPTIPAFLSPLPGEGAVSSSPDGPWTFPVVVKPRWGAGSQGMFLGRNESDLHRRLQETEEIPGATPMIVQPYVVGRALSVAALFPYAGNRSPVVWPIAEQRLSDNGDFGYLGGAIPAGEVDAAAVKALVQQAAATISGLRGYIGFDLLVPHADPHRPLLVEINPRLTTSYVGYRRLAKDNLASRLLGLDDSPPEWRNLRVSYSAEGMVETVPLLSGVE